jgi:hypothetical protein
MHPKSTKVRDSGILMSRSPGTEREHMKYEYKSIVLPFKLGLFRQGLPDEVD